MDILDINDMLVVTIVIQMHGTVITYELSSSTSDIFDNVRLLCKAGGLKEYVSGESGLPGITEELMLVSNLREIFGKDIDSSTYDIISNARSGLLIGNITFDKTLSTTSGNWDLTDYFQGIYLLSIHQQDNLIYPNPDEKVINLLNVEDLHRLASFFDSRVPNLEDISIPFPNQEIYIEEENRVNKNPNLSEYEKKQKIKGIKKQFMNLLGKWELTLDNSGNIEVIKLSCLVELVKNIIGENIIINLLDYSCNVPTSYIPEETIASSKFIVPDDIETGLKNREYGGKKKKTKKMKKTKKTKRVEKKKKRTKKRRSKRKKSH